MNDSELRQLAEALTRIIRPHLERSEELRHAAGLIGRWICEIASQADQNTKSEALEARLRRAPEASPEYPSAGTDAVVTTDKPVAASALSPTSSTVSSGFMPLTLGQQVVRIPVSGTTEELERACAAAVEPKPQEVTQAEYLKDSGDIDLVTVEQRCRLKADACRLCIERQSADADSDAVFKARHQMDEMIARAKAMPNCFLWVFSREHTQPDNATLSRIADNYKAHADAVALMLRIDNNAPETGRKDDEVMAFHLLAEANSALRVALADTWITKPDSDQFEAHVWLKRETSLRRVYIERHMSLDDPADPSDTADLRERIRQANSRFDESADRDRKIKNDLKRIRYHANLIVKNGADSSSEHWEKIDGARVRLRNMGIAATDNRITKAIGPEAAALWPPESPKAGDLSESIARAMSLRDDPEADTSDEPQSTEREWSPRVHEVRNFLRGKRIVVIGGERNAKAVDRLEKAFELTQADWITLSEHGSGATMRAPIQRPDTAAVIVIIKLTGHLHVDEAKGYADAAGKPCVRLMGGYNPENVAQAILDQASDRLFGRTGIG